MESIRLDNVWEIYRVKFIIDGKTKWDNIWALKDISFSVARGEAVGIIGPNGAGKSTLLKLIAGMLAPDRGEITVEGRVSGLLELGAGFEPELTGHDNIYLCGSLFGLSKAEIEKKYDSIVKFASLGKFIYAPVKCYSQGMFVRLAFSIAVHIEPDIFLIDDTLAVGDENFQRKCFKKVFEIREKGVTFVFVTHDIGMLRKLCSRVIFLKDGRIIKDSNIDTVVPLYSQFSGNRNEIASFKKGDLHIVFNAGRLFLNWKDRLITPHYGGYVSIEVERNWYNSFQAQWEVTKSEEDNIEVIGNFYPLLITQVWRLSLNGGSLKWIVENRVKEGTSIQQVCFNLMLDKGYISWKSYTARGEFPSIPEDMRNWYPVASGGLLGKFVGVEAHETDKQKLPSVVFGYDEDSYFSQTNILNSDYLTNCRILQYIMKCGETSPSVGGFFLTPSVTIKFNVPDAASYIEKISTEYTLLSKRMKLLFQQGKLLLLYNNRFITQFPHAFTAIHINDRWYYSTMASWHVDKIEDNYLYVMLKWVGVSFTQHWHIRVIEDDSFVWEVEEEGSHTSAVIERRIEFLFCKEYLRYFCEYETGDFPSIFTEYPQDMLQCCIRRGEFGLRGELKSIPVVSFKVIGDNRSFGKIFNSDIFQRGRSVVIYNVSPEEKENVNGRLTYFKIKVSLKDAYNIENVPSVITNKRVKFVFDKGRGRIFWDDREITKHLSFYTSMRAGGRWYDSFSSASWRDTYNKNSNMEVNGEWDYIPLGQKWSIEVLPGAVLFKIILIVQKDIEVERLQTNVMLSEKYKKWHSFSQKGIFPEFRPDIDSDWEIIVSDNDYKGKCVAVDEVKEGFPEVNFYVDKAFSAGRLNIVNSDLYHRARLLQWVDDRQERIKVGEYLYCEGKIIFNGDNIK